MKIKRIEPIAVSLPMTKPLKMAFEEVKSAENVLARVETDEGVIGWGGAGAAPTMTGETVASMAAAIRYLAPKLEGMDLEDIAAVMKRGFVADDGTRWLGEALAERTGTTDTHPSLRDRLRALGVAADTPPALAETAADRLLGDAYPALLAELGMSAILQAGV